MSLKRQLITASSWLLTSHAAIQAVRLATNLVLTRLLVPEMFGVMALASVYFTALGMLSDLGLQKAVVQNPRGEDPDFLNTVWMLQIARGTLIFVLGLGVAALVQTAAAKGWVPRSSAYAAPELPWAIAVISSSAIVASLGSTKTFLAHRHLTMARVTVLQLVAQLLAVAVMICWASVEPSIDVLLAGAIVSSGTQALLSHKLLPGPDNSFHWNRQDAISLLKFGKWIFVSSILGFLINHTDRILLGWLLDAEVLGYYAIAALLVGALRSTVRRLVGTVVYAGLGQVVREQPRRLFKLYYRIRSPINALCLGSAGFLFMAGGDIVHVLYDDRYSAAGVFLEILALSLIVVSYGVIGEIYILLDRTRVIAATALVRLVLMGVAIPTGYQFFGAQGAVWGIVLSGFSYVIIALAMLKPKLHLLDIGKEIRLATVLPLGLLAGGVFSWASKVSV